MRKHRNTNPGISCGVKKEVFFIHFGHARRPKVNPHRSYKCRRQGFGLDSVFFFGDGFDHGKPSSDHRRLQHFMERWDSAFFFFLHAFASPRPEKCHC